MLLVLLVSLAASSDGNLVVTVQKKGNVTWTGDCTVDVVPKSADAAAVPSAKPDQEIPLVPGDYDVTVACPTTEGVVKKVFTQKMTTRDDKKSIVLEPGFLIVNVKRFDTPVPAEVTITDEAGHELAKTKERAVVPVAAGKVRILAKVNDAKAARPVLGNATHTVLPMKKDEVVVDTTDGELTLSLTNNGKKTDGVGWLRVPGDATHLVELRAGEKASVPPGTYELVTQLQDAHDFAEIVTKNISITPQKAIARSVNHSTSAVDVLVLVDGRPPPADAKIDVELYQAGAAQPFNTIARGEKLKLKPGSIDIAAKRTDQTLDDGGVLFERKTVRVSGNATVVFDLKAAHLDVTTTVGKKPKALEVTLRLPEGTADAILAKKSTGDDGKVSFSMLPARYTVSVTLKAAQGEVTSQKQVTLRGGSSMGLSMDLDVGTAMVQVFAKGVSVPAEVRFMAVSKGTVAQEPLLAVPAGQDAVLPPGTYTVVVKRKGKETSVADVKIAAGALYERTVEVAE